MSIPTPSVSGARIGAHTIFIWTITRVRGDHQFFPPTQIAAIKAVACELPSKLDLPFSRLSLSALQAYVIEQHVVEHISLGKLWTILDEDAIRPWYHRSWLFQRDPQFAEMAGPILDLYQGTFEQHELRAREYVLSFDQKTSIQARARTSERAGQEWSSAMGRA